MRKILFIALVALCFTFPGKVDANPTPLTPQLIENAQGEIDPALVETILRYIQVEYDYDYSCLCSLYQNGNILIEKSPQGYAVTIDDGGIATTLVMEDL